MGISQKADFFYIWHCGFQGVVLYEPLFDNDIIIIIK